MEALIDFDPLDPTGPSISSFSWAQKNSDIQIFASNLDAG